MTMKENRPIRLEYCNKLEKKEEEKVDIFPLYFPLAIIFPPPYLFYYFSPLSLSPIRYIIDRIGSIDRCELTFIFYYYYDTIRYDDDYST